MNTNHPGPQEPHDPVLDHLYRALTAAGDAGELAGQDAALTMFRDSRRPSRRRRFAASIPLAAAAIVIIGGIAAAAYAAVLPAPVQHMAYRMLARIGVPDVQHPAPASSAPSLAGPAPSALPPAAATGCPCRTSQSAAAVALSMSLTAGAAQIPADGDDTLSGQLARGGSPESGVRVQLLEQAADGSAWRVAGSALTDRDGQVSLTVQQLTSNASFRLAGPQGATSATVSVAVIPAVSVHLARGPLPGTRILTVRSGFADTGDEVVLQERSGTTWYSIGERPLDQHHLASFTLLVPRIGGAYYRVVLSRTAAHGSSASAQVRVARRLASGMLRFNFAGARQLVAARGSVPGMQGGSCADQVANGQ